MICFMKLHSFLLFHFYLHLFSLQWNLETLDSILIQQSFIKLIKRDSKYI